MDVFLERVLGPYVSTVLTSIITYFPPTYCQLEAENWKEGQLLPEVDFLITARKEIA